MSTISVPETRPGTHLVMVNSIPDSPNVWLECDQCPYTLLWDGVSVNTLFDAPDPKIEHLGSW